MVNDQILLTYYFNMGVDAVVGMAVERNRTKRRCCNYVIYALKGAYEMIYNATANKISNSVTRVVSSKRTGDGETHEKVVADLSKLKSSAQAKDPFNLCGYNLNQGYGGFLS